MDDETLREGVHTAESNRRYRENYDQIKGFGQKARPGRYYLFDDGLVHADDLTSAQRLELNDRTRRKDNVNFFSEAMSIHPKQIPEFERFCAERDIKGVKFDPEGGCHLRDSRAKRSFQTAREFVDNDDIKGGHSRG